MLSKTVIIGIATGFNITALADLPDDFMAALALYNSKKYEQAHEAFLKVAEIAPTPRSKARSLAYAASSLSRQDQYERAIELAKSIAVTPISINCQMEIMLAHQKFGELVEAFKDEDISAWPDDIIHRGFYNRGTAYARTRGKTQAAMNDLEKAVETSDTTGFFQVRALNELARLYRALKQDDKALKAHRRALADTACKGLYSYYDSGINAARILLARGKHDEALVELRKLDPLPPAGIWRFSALEMSGDIYAAQGKKDRAIIRYKEATQVANMRQDYIDRVKKKMEKLSGE